jgi:di/tricarboxylate transporter
MEVRTRSKLEIEPEFKLKDATLASEDMALVEVLVAPWTRLAGRTLAETEFHSRFNAIVLALQRAGHFLRDQIARVPLRFGDALLILLPKTEVRHLRASGDLIVLTEGEAPPLRGRSLKALAITAAVVALTGLNVLPITVSAILGCLAVVVTRCVRIEEAYEAIDWQVIFLLAGILPLGLALERSGAAAILSQQLVGSVGILGPVAVLAVFYLLAAVLTEFMSNNAAAVLLAPVAISSAVALGVDPRPLLVAVAFAASTSFATPVGYQTNAMVYGPGGYRFTDFTRVGVPLNLLFWGLSVWLIPLFWPL